MGDVKVLVFATVLLLVNQGCWSFRPDQVTDLPGLDQAPNFKHYSGYLQVSEKHFLHYWLVESENSPATDPLVIWFNGGPGCSSLDALFTEHGPFRIKKGGQSLYYNPYRWNKIANILFLESPVGVGFSYSTDKDYETDDDIVAEDNQRAIHVFYKKFPEFQNRTLFVTGESYAGIYIPTLLIKTIADPTINVKGAAIGNGYVHVDLLAGTMYPYWYYHGLVSSRMWKDLTDACCENSNHTNCSFVYFRNEQCQAMAAKLTIMINSLPINPYNIYGPCETSSFEAAKASRTTSLISLMIEQATRKFNDLLVASKFRALAADVQSFLPCVGTNDIEAYMNKKEVQISIHVKTTLPRWTLCSTSVSKTYHRLYETMKPQFLEILKHNIELLVFNGDQDTVCNFFGDEQFVDDLDLKEITPRKPWYYTSAKDSTKQIGGFAHRFKDLTYATVKGAGHMVPTDQPVSSFEMFQRFIHGIPL